MRFIWLPMIVLASVLAGCSHQSTSTVNPNSPQYTTDEVLCADDPSTTDWGQASQDLSSATPALAQRSPRSTRCTGLSRA